MTKIDIFSGFLGAGKTTLIKKLIAEAYTGEQLVLIENEFGEIGIDGGFLQEAGINITEMNSGCICCSLVGDFGKALRQVMDTYHPDRILIEPSGVGKLSDVIRAVQNLEMHDVVLNGFTTVVDATKAKMYMRNFGEFFDNQVQYAGAIIMSRTDIVDEKKAMESMELLRSINEKAAIITTPIEKLDGKKILEVMEHPVSLADELLKEEHEHHHHHDHDEECGCGHDHDHEHHHDHDEECDHDHEHHHHDHDEECGCGHDHDHEHHHHDHDEECGCGHDHDHEHHHHDHDEDHDEHDHEHGDHCCCGHHHHHHDHDADEVFTSWGVETARKFTKAEVEHALTELDTGAYGMILRSKGIVDGGADGWLEFDYVPGEWEVRARGADVGGKLVVIGSKLNEKAIAELFGC